MKNYKILLLSLLSLLLFSCEDDMQMEILDFEKPIIVQQLDFEANMLDLGSFVDGDVDSVLINGVKGDFYMDNTKLIFHAGFYSEKYLVAKIYQNGESTDVVLRKSDKRYVLFSYSAKYDKNKKYQVAGDFNGWAPTNTNLQWHDTAYQAVMELTSGKYQYQIVEDGEWKLDEYNPITAPNNQGGVNSVFVVGSGNEAKLQLSTESYTDNNISFSINDTNANIIVMFNNKDISSELKKGDMLNINIPEIAKQYELSYIRVFAFNANGIANDLMIPLVYGKVSTSITELPRTAWQTNILYNVFVDRFFDGNPENNNPLPDSIVLPAANYNGGDMEGIMDKIDADYFSELGVNSLWLSPLVKNVEGAYGYWPDPKTKFSAYHGYWPVSFTQINPHFGDSDDLHNLVAAVHNDDMNILLDFVANHVHQDHPFIKAHPEYATELHLPDGTLNLERWDEYRLTTWFDKFLPSLNLENEKVSKTVADSATWWITEYDIDGFRHDAAKHVPLSFWKRLTREIRDKVVLKNDKQVYQLGETYGNSELIGSYVNNGMLNAQFDFNVYDAAVGVFAGDNSMNTLAERLEESLNVYGSHNVMAYITGNQDRGRFISYAGGDLKFDEDAKEAGWTRKIGVGDDVGYLKLQQLMAFNMSIPGIPVIYYGDEFGMAGGNDPDCRRMMRFDNQLTEKEKINLEVTKILIAIRKSNMALLYGDVVSITPNNSTLIIHRKYFDNEVYSVFNTSDQEQQVNISIKGNAKKYKTSFGNKMTVKNNVLTITIAPNSFEIIIK